MAEYQDFLAILDSDPSNAQALAALEKIVPTLAAAEAATALGSSRAALRARGAHESALRLYDVELAAVADQGRKADLWLEKGQLFADDLLDEGAARACLQEVLALRPEDGEARELRELLDEQRENWPRFVEKFLAEARSSTDRGLTTSLYLSAAEMVARYQPGAPEVEAYLARALDADARNRRAALHLERLYRRSARWDDLAQLFRRRVELAERDDERARALLDLADLAQGPLGRPADAIDAMKRLAAIDPANPRALAVLADQYERESNWSALVMLYGSALKTRNRALGPGAEVGMLLQIGMLLWKRLGSPEAAEEYFARLVKLEPAHPAALEFYREHLGPRAADRKKLIQLFRSALKAVPEGDEARRHGLSVTIAELSEQGGEGPERAIDSWKAILRQQPDNGEARDALKRLYTRGEKWNALLHLLKDEIDRLPAADLEGRIAGLLEVVAIYRDRLRLDDMVINVYASILALDPANRPALDALAEKYRQRGQWNDLIAVLGKKADLATLAAAERAAVLRDIWRLWIEKFGNFAQAIRPLEQLVALDPGDGEALTHLKEIYGKRRQWRALIALLGREADAAPLARRRALHGEMAHLASDKLGDLRLAIDVWNRLLELPEPDAGGGPTVGEALAALAQLYDKDKRYLALAEVLRRQIALAAPAERPPLYERLGTLFAERLRSPGQAAEVYRELIQIEPGHTRAARVLRELYAQTGDYAALEEVYAALGQWDEMSEALVALADRTEPKEAKLTLLQRAAEVAARATQRPVGRGGDGHDRVTRVYERMLVLDPHHLAAARALVPIYTRIGKWPRLLAIHEILLGHAADDAERLSIIGEIRQLCERRLGSKALAFQWTARAYELDPTAPALLAELERLGAEADAWDEVARVLDRRVAAPALPEEERLSLLRELGKIAAQRLHDLGRAHGYWQSVLAARPEEPAAMAALEEIATHRAEWPELLALFRRRVELEPEGPRKLDLLARIAFLEEERIGDLAAAVRTHRRILDLDPAARRSIKALAKLSEASDDPRGLVDALERELALTQDPEGQAAILCRLGDLQAGRLQAHDAARAAYERAFALSPHSRAAQQGLERQLERDDRPVIRRELAALLLPHHLDDGEYRRAVDDIEILKQAAPPADIEAFDRKLVELYRRLDEPRRSYDAALAVFARAPGDGEVRTELRRLADALGLHADLADTLELMADEVAAAGRDPALVRRLRGELAELCTEHLVDPARAETAWRKILAGDPADAEAAAALGDLYRTGEQWTELRELYRRQLALSPPPARQRELLLAICELSEGVLEDPAAAIAAYRELGELEPGLRRVTKALERLYRAADDAEALAALFARAIDQADRQDDRLTAMVRRAELLADRLGDPAGAVDLAAAVVAARPEHAEARALLERLVDQPGVRQRVAALLEPLYTDDAMWSALARNLRIQREAAGPDLAAALLGRVAAIEESRLEDRVAALTTWSAVLELAPGDAGARAAVLRLAGELDRPSAAAAALEAAIAAADPDDRPLLATLHRELAGLAEGPLADPARAVAAWQVLLTLDPGDLAGTRAAAVALARLHEAAARWDDLAVILRRKADLADPEGRRAILVRLAELEEGRRNDAAAAVRVWREILELDPGDPAALDALERLHRAAGEPALLAEIIRRRVALATEPARQKAELFRLARLYEIELQQPTDAIAAYLEALAAAPDDLEALDELGRLYRLRGPLTDLIDVLERRRALTRHADPRRALTLELGELLADSGRTEEAVELLAEVLAEQPGEPTALARLELVEQAGGDAGAAAGAVLLPIYEAAGDDRKLAELLARVAAQSAGEPRARTAHLRRVAALRERSLGDPDGAFAALADAAMGAAAEPDLKDILADLARLAAERGRLPDLIDLYRDLVGDVLDGDLARRLQLDIADLSRAVRGDVGLARRYYQAVLEAAPDDRRALTALEGILRDGGELSELHDVVVRKAELGGDDLEARAAALSEAARLSRELGRPVDAIAEWEQVLELIPDSGEAGAALEQLYLEAERWHDLAELLERRLGFAHTVDDAIALRFRLGELCERELGDTERAVDNYAAVLGGDPDHRGATAALERLLDDAATRALAAEVLQPFYVAHQDWPKLVRIYEIKLDAEPDPSVRLKLTRYIARLYEDQLEDLEGAFRWYGRVFRESPTDAALRNQLVRLAGVLDGWGELVAIYQDFLDDTPGDPPEVRDVALAVAELSDRRLGQVDQALAAYRRVLASAPDDQQTFARAEDLLSRAGRWYDLVELVHDAITVADDDARRVALLRRAAGLWEQRLTDPAKAIDELRSAFDLAPDDAATIADLERLLAAQAQWFELAELLRGRIDRAIGTADEIPLRLRLAEVLETRQDDADGAIDQWEKALEVGDDPDALAELERLVVDHRHRGRIAALLEPVYRRRDWWRKLVVILDARLEFVRDRVPILREIAELHETRGGDLSLALDALGRAWLADPIDDDVYADLAALAGRLGAWDALAATLDRALEGELDDADLQVTILRRLAELHETRRDAPEAAIAAHERVLALAEDDPAALAALDRLLVRTGRDERLAEVLGRLAAIAGEPAEQRAYHARAAALLEGPLARPQFAIDAWRAVLELDGDDLGALGALERLYRATAQPALLIAVLERRIELSAAASDRRALHLEVARLHHGEPHEAVAHLRAALDLDPDDREALARLDAIFQAEAAWPELVEVLDRRAALESDASGRAELAFRAAEAVRGPLFDRVNAVERLAQVTALVPAHPGARAALEALLDDDDTLESAAAVLDGLYTAEGQHDAIAGLIERRLAAGSGDERAALFTRLATLHERDRGDQTAAFRVLARALAERPDDPDLQAELERLAAARAAWPELVEVYSTRLHEASDGELEAHYAVLLGRVHDEAIGDLGRAAEAYRRALAARGDDEATLDLLARVVERDGRHAELAEALERQAASTTDGGRQAELLYRLGEVREARLGEVVGAVEAYREVLDRQPAHPATRAALERLVGDERIRAEVVQVLEPLYADAGDHARLADLLAAKLSVTADPFDRAALYGRLAELSERHLGDGLRAFDAIGGWLAEEPGSEQALAELERLAAATRRWPEAAVRLRSIAGSTESPEVRQTLLAHLGAIELDRLTDLPAAAATFRELRGLDPDGLATLGALERIYRATGERRELAEVLERRAELVLDARARLDLHAEAAGLRESLGEIDRAVAGWRRALEADEGNQEAFARLAGLYEGLKDHRALVDTLGEWARFASGREQEVALRRKIAVLEGDVLGDLDAAAAAWQDVLELAPDDDDALTALERVHSARGDALAVQEVMVRQLEAARGDRERIAVLRRMAAVAERGIAPTDGPSDGGSIDDAAAHLGRILEIDPDDAEAQRELERLLGRGERWHELIALFERRAERSAALGDDPAEIAALAAAADVWEERLDNPDAAGQILERVLAREPRYVPALVRLARIYESGGQLDRMAETLDRALALGPTGAHAAMLHLKLGELAEQNGDPAAIDRYEDALRHDPTHLGALAAVERLARATGDRPRLGAALTARIDLAEPAARPLIAVELAGLWIEDGHVVEALPLLEQAHLDLPDDTRVTAALADAYVAVGRHGEAAPLYDGLVEQARKARQMKDVARFRQRQAGLYAAVGEVERALAAYEEAFRIDPSNVATMAGLGRLYLERRDWDKARKVFRSLVLQTIDPGAGITKGEVYYHLGAIHRELGERDKARGMFQRGLDLEPDNAQLREALASTSGP